MFLSFVGEHDAPASLRHVETTTLGVVATLMLHFILIGPRSTPSFVLCYELYIFAIPSWEDIVNPG